MTSKILACDELRNYLKENENNDKVEYLDSSNKMVLNYRNQSLINHKSFVWTNQNNNSKSNSFDRKRTILHGKSFFFKFFRKI